MSEKDRLAFVATASSMFDVYFSFAMEMHDRLPGLPAKVYDLLLWKKGMVAASVTGERARIAASGDAEALKLLDQVIAKRNEYAWLAGAKPSDYEQWRRSLEQLRNEANELETQLAQRSTMFAEDKKLSRPSWRDVQKSLKPYEATVEFIHFPFYDGKQWSKKSYYAAIILRADSASPQWVTLGEAQALTEVSIDDYRDRISKSPPEKADTGIAFYRSFWKPLERFLSGATRVYISPDGVLSLISWAAIPTDGGRLLIEKYDVDVVLSTKDLLQKWHRASALSAVLIGNAKFDLSESDQRAAVAAIETARESQTLATSPEKSTSSAKQAAGKEATNATKEVALNGPSREDRGGPLDPLPGTQEEVRSIGSILMKQKWQVESHTQENALEEAIKDVKGPRLLHIATHGFFERDEEPEHGETMQDKQSFLRDPMLRSGLYFAGADRARSGLAPAANLDDGVLTAYEAAGLNLQGTELVVLSACKTGFGDVQNGEGVFGLRRALQEAGAEAVLMSLWSVPDEETQELMTSFYRKWLEGKEKHEALHEAQLELRKKVKGYWGDDRPYYWAAFVLVGR
jgi:CHAT domain-containing protein